MATVNTVYGTVAIVSQIVYMGSYVPWALLYKEHQGDRSREAEPCLILPLIRSRELSVSPFSSRTDRLGKYQGTTIELATQLQEQLCNPEKIPRYKTDKQE